MPDRKILLGIALGVGGIVAAPFAATILGPAARPFAKVLLKQTVLAFEKLREKLATLGEELDDLVAEVRVEVEDELVRRGPRGREKHDGSSAEPEANGPAAPAPGDGTA